MGAALSPLFEAMLFRERDGISAAVKAVAASDGVSELFKALTRFAVLAFAPSEHGRAALLTTVACSDYHAAVSDPIALGVECAVYLADTRAPWSEPPIGDPPPLPPDQRRDLAELKEAVEQQDRLRAERWIAALAPDDAALFFEAAADVPDESGQSVAVAVALWRIASHAPPQARFAVLQNAAIDWTRRDETVAIESPDGDWRSSLQNVIHEATNHQLGILELQRVIALDAARFIDVELGLSELASKIAANNSPRDVATESAEKASSETSPEPIYAFARDYGCYLQICAITNRLDGAFDKRSLAILRRRAWEQQERESFAEWTLA